MTSGGHVGRPATDGPIRSQISTASQFSAHFNVSRETIEKLEIYGEKLRLWQKAVNLVAPRTLSAFWHRHAADSAQLISYIPVDVRSLVDLGSGGGFPGLVLAIFLQERANPPKITLIESDQRKCAFLRDVARSVDNPVDILSTRIEGDESFNATGKVDVISARALAPLSGLLTWAEIYGHASTVCLFPKGRSVQTEIADANRDWRFHSELHPSVTDDEGRIVVVRGVARRR